MATTNDVQWAGNYQAANITSIEADLINLGPTDLEIRLVLFYFGSPFARYTSTTAFALAVGGGWRHATFSLAPGSMTLVDGTGSYAQTISDVGRIMFRHDAGSPSSQGTPVVGQMGLDNIRAVPEPATLLVLLAGLGGMRRRR